MKIGLPGAGSSVDRIVSQAQRAEADGFCALWYTSGTLNDPLIAMALAGRATEHIELGTAIANTYACHPVLLASRAAAAVEAIGAPGRFTLGVGPSHQPFVEGMLGHTYDHPGRHTEEYLEVLAPLLRGEAVQFTGQELPLPVNASPPALLDGQPVPLLVAALGPRLLRLAGRHADGTIPWMANARAIETHIAPIITKAAADAGRPKPRIVAGLPVAVHDDEVEARSVAQVQFGMYGQLDNYARIFDRGGVAGPAEAAIVGDEASVTQQVQELFDAGATEVWLAAFPVGDDRAASRARTRQLLVELANS
jgi:F420-dependent oxidoreductase-like protein